MRHRLLSLLLLSVVLPTIGPGRADAQVRRNEQQRPPSMTLEDYDPHSMLVTRETVVRRSKFPFVDIHGHQDLTMSDGELARLVAQMDAMNMRTMNNLSGGSGERLAAQVRNVRAKYPGRFTVFANIDWSRINEPNFARDAADQLERDVKEGGAVGLKIFKNLGMDTYWADGSRVRTDDPRLAPIWDKCGELGIPVLIHTAEPPAFFLPIDARNERYLELTQFPNRARPSSKYPPFDSLIAEQHRMFKRHARTQFISAHLSWLGQDLQRLSRTMDSIPNMNVEVAAALYEIGRQPRAGRDFFIKYQDRILMEGHLRWSGRVRGVLPHLRVERRVLPVVPEAARVLGDVRTVAAGLGASEGVLSECSQAGERNGAVSCCLGTEY